MRLFWEVARRAFRRHSAYRSATLAGIFTNTVFAFINASILLAVFRQRDSIGGFDARDAVTFVFVGQGFLVVMGMFGGHLALADRIQTGDIVTDLYRPVDLQVFELAADLGRAGFHATVRAVVPLLAGGLAFDLRLPSSGATWALFLLSATIGLVVSFAHRFLISLTTFWTLDYRAASQMAVVVSMFLSGFAVPIVFFPAWLETLARWSPYAAVAQVPIEILLGKHEGVAGIGGALLVSALWAAALLALGRAVLAIATRRLVVQGG